ncbi:MAG: DNA polymerase III subunit epsilon [Hyphomonadaceae bacterium]|nr:DNA polymerase III subunit epsilon [Hyphomonadaceae bacterium]
MANQCRVQVSVPWPASTNSERQAQPCVAKHIWFTRIFSSVIRLQVKELNEQISGKDSAPTASTSGETKPLVLITGAAGNLGTSLSERLRSDYTIVGFDIPGTEADFDLIGCDMTSDQSVSEAMERLATEHGRKIAAVIHLAAYFDFTGEEHPLYQKLNVEGTRRLLEGLQDFEVGRFIYSGTMLVHEAGKPGQPITEETALNPKWAYPQSKARAEEAIRETHGDIPYTLLHLAGVYDEHSAVPTLTEQIRRIYERNPHGHAYAAPLSVGQAFLHKDDMVEAFARVVAKRDELPAENTILVGEPDTVSYGDLQREIAELIHGDSDWRTFTLPKPLASFGAWIESKSEPVVPDDIDQGEKPFIRPFMVDMADDHYELSIDRARHELDWEPRRRLRDTLPEMVANLKADPLGWYNTNGITPPPWLTAAGENEHEPEEVRAEAEKESIEQHRNFLWAPFLNMAMGAWLATSPSVIPYNSVPLIWNDVLCGIAVVLLGFLSLSWKLRLVRWAIAGIAAWVMFAPLALWAPTGAVYLNQTLSGALIFGFAVLARPTPGVHQAAAVTGPTIPPGWDESPSSWFQRVPIIALAVIGFLISRHMTAYQLGHIDGVWEPFFSGVPDNGKNGTEEIVTSSVSEAWPVPDAGVGAFTYMLEILIGIVGSTRRWRTMPWLVLIFGIMIVPLGIVSITFIVIQPIVIGTWCTLCLIAAAAMLLQIPYSVDEIIAPIQFLIRRKKKGRPILWVLFRGDTDEGPDERVEDDLLQPPGQIISKMIYGGMTFPWTLLVSIALGVWLMFTRLTLGTDGALADADHLLGALVITVSVAALAEPIRSIRLLNMFLGAAVALMPFIVDASLVQMAADVIVGLAIGALSLPRGKIQHRFGDWNRHLI